MHIITPEHLKHASEMVNDYFKSVTGEGDIINFMIPIIHHTSSGSVSFHCSGFYHLEIMPLVAKEILDQYIVEIANENVGIASESKTIN